MKYKKWDDFKLHASSIYPVLSNPRGCNPLNDREVQKLADLRLKETRSEKEEVSMARLISKNEKSLDPPLSKTAINHLIRRYSYEKYNKLVIAAGTHFPTVQKGNLLEDDGIKLLSQYDNIQYVRNTACASNEYLIGKCDVFCKEKNKIIDLKVSWNINTFLTNRITELKNRYWFQMQGYLELHDADYGEVCFVLINTPLELIEKERFKTMFQYITGEIDREKYDEKMEILDLAFNYDKIPLRRRIIRFTVERRADILLKLYNKIHKCREWLAWFEQEHMGNKKIITLSDRYVKATQDGNTESDPTDVHQDDTE